MQQTQMAIIACRTTRTYMTFRLILRPCPDCLFGLWMVLAITEMEQNANSHTSLVEMLASWRYVLTVLLDFRN